VATEKKDQDKGEMPGTRVAGEKPEGQNISDRVDDVAAALRDRNQARDMERVWMSLDSVIASQQHLIERVTHALTISKGIAEQCLTMVEQLTASYAEKLKARDQHLEDMRMALRVIETVAQQHTTVNVNMSDD
jgi:hypothetical protein